MSFLGVAVFYAKFIPDFEAIANPLVLCQLVKKYKSKEASVTRDPVLQQAFDDIKAALCLAPVLAFPDFNRPWLLMTDASYGKIAAVLCQMGSDGVERPIAYASRMLTDTETRYGNTSKEGLALVYAQRNLRCYFGSGSMPAVATTDHSALKSLRSKTVFPTVCARAQ